MSIHHLKVRNNAKFRRAIDQINAMQASTANRYNIVMQIVAEQAESLTDTMDENAVRRSTDSHTTSYVSFSTDH